MLWQAYHGVQHGVIQRYKTHTLKVRPEMFVYDWIDHAGGSWLFCGTYKAFVMINQVRILRKWRDSKGAVSHNTEFSPQLHALMKMFHIEINVVGLQLVFCC